MSSSPIMDRIQKNLEKKKYADLFRTLAKPLEVRIDLSTNSYLCLHSNQAVLTTFARMTAPHFHGNLASRLISNTSQLYTTLEYELAQWKKSEAALLFNSGYAANVGTIQALCTRHTEVFSDKLNHASIIDGIMLSGARLVRYNHCDMKDLNKKLSASSSKEKIIITDTVFSMDGDIAPLDAICDLGKKYNALIMVDEAHATCLYGKSLCGIVEALGLTDVVDISIGTMSKAFAGIGGFFCGKTVIKEFLVNNSRSFIYSTGLGEAMLAWNCAALNFVKNNSEFGNQVLILADRFRLKLTEQGFNTGLSKTHIIPCILGNPSLTLQASRFLLDHGIKVPAIRTPTVPEGSERLRFSVHLEFTPQQQDEVIELLVAWRKTVSGKKI